MAKVPQVPHKKDPPLTEEDRLRWERMREDFAAEWFTAYLLYQSDTGAYSVIKEHVARSHTEDDFKSFVHKKDVGLICIVEHDTTCIVWAGPDCSKVVGEPISEIHRMWTELSNQPRYFTVGGVTHDNWIGGKSCA